MAFYSNREELHFYTLGEALGKLYREPLIGKPYKGEDLKAFARKSCPAIESFSCEQYYYACLSGFERGYNYIEIRESMMHSAKVYGTAHE
jgi:hypothetical protein